jgi:hypothetical protein
VKTELARAGVLASDLASVAAPCPGDRVHRKIGIGTNFCVPTGESRSQAGWVRRRLIARAMEAIVIDFLICAGFERLLPSKWYLKSLIITVKIILTALVYLAKWSETTND